MYLSRRSLLAGIGGAAAATPVSTAADSNDTWPASGGGNSRTNQARKSLPGDGVDQQWQTEVPSDAAATPVHDGELLFVPTWDDGVFTLQLDDGRQRWHGAAGSSLAGIALTDDMLVITTNDGRLAGFNPATGSQRWETELGHSIETEPTIADDKVFLRSSEGFAVVDLGSGEQIWQRQDDQRVSLVPATEDGVAFIGTHSGQFEAIEIATGETIWHKSADGPLVSTPVITNEAVIAGFGAEEGKVVAFDRETGAERWRVDVPVQPFGVGGLADDELLFTGTRNERTRLFSVDPVSGDVKWTRDFESHIARAPLVAGDRAYLLSMGGTIQCVEIREGSTVWSTSGVSDAKPWAMVPDDGGGLIVIDRENVVTRLAETESSVNIPGFGPLAAIGGLGGYAYLKRSEES